MDHSSSATGIGARRLPGMVHLIKLAVGIRDAAHLASAQQRRARDEGVLRHRTRLAPRRADELLNGGSIYWVVAGTLLMRQRIVGVVPAQRDDGTPCVALHLDAALVAVAPRAVRAFQGWRYLEAADAPQDLAALTAEGEASLPGELARALRALALI
jgi:hypothetical protein